MLHSKLCTIILSVNSKQLLPPIPDPNPELESSLPDPSSSSIWIRKKDRIRGLVGAEKGPNLRISHSRVLLPDLSYSSESKIQLSIGVGLLFRIWIQKKDRNRPCCYHTWKKRKCISISKQIFVKLFFSIELVLFFLKKVLTRVCWTFKYLLGPGEVEPKFGQGPNP